MTKKQKRKLVSLAVGLFIAGLTAVANKQGWVKTATQTAVSAQPGLYSVTEFVDGDTITVDMNGKKETIRFIGVDTPETHDPRKAVQCYGMAAASFTKDFIGSSNVRLETDPTNTNRDRYNRLLRYVYLPNNTLVNAEIIKRGYGFAYTSFPFTKAEDFRAYEKEAREQSRGLWKDCTPIKNDFGGYSSNDAI